MLDAAVPLPDCLLPAMAIVLRDLKSGYATGAPAKLTALDDEVIREAFDRMKKWDKSFSVGHAHEYLAEIRDRSQIN